MVISIEKWIYVLLPSLPISKLLSSNTIALSGKILSCSGGRLS